VKPKAVKPNALSNTKLSTMFRSLLAACLISIFCFGNSAIAANLTANLTANSASQTAANSYRENLSRLRSQQIIAPVQEQVQKSAQEPLSNKSSIFDNFSDFKEAHKKSNLNKTVVDRSDSSTGIEIIETIETNKTASVQAFSTHLFDNRSSSESDDRSLTENTFPSTERSPYAVIAAARQPHHATQISLTLPSFSRILSKQWPEQLFGQLNQLRTGLQKQPSAFAQAARQVGPAIEKRFSGVNDRIHQIPHQLRTAISNALDQAGTKAHQTAEQLRQS
jgi:hypothetical protein